MNRELLKKNFEQRGYRVFFFDNKEQATEFMLSEIKDTTVGFGGSETTKVIDLHTKLAEQGNTVYRHSRTTPPEIREYAIRSEVFILSANGVAETGEMVNIDGRGNRVAGSLFGPKRVYYVVGRNKITPDLHSALQRAQTIAAPLNAKRLDCKTPCAEKGDDCYECRKSGNPGSICNATVIYDRPMMDMEATIVFIDEDLGL